MSLDKMGILVAVNAHFTEGSKKKLGENKFYAKFVKK